MNATRWEVGTMQEYIDRADRLCAALYGASSQSAHAEAAAALKARQCRALFAVS